MLYVWRWIGGLRRGVAAGDGIAGGKCGLLHLMVMFLGSMGDAERWVCEDVVGGLECQRGEGGIKCQIIQCWGDC